MCQMHVTGTAVPLPAKPASRPACLPPPPQKVPSRTRTPMGSNLTVMEKSRIRKAKGKDASKSLRDRKKSYEAGLKRRLAALNQEAKDLAEAEAALQAQRRRMLTCITALTPPSSPGDTGHGSGGDVTAPGKCGSDDLQGNALWDSAFGLALFVDEDQGGCQAPAAQTAGPCGGGGGGGGLTTTTATCTGADADADAGAMAVGLGLDLDLDAFYFLLEDPAHDSSHSSPPPPANNNDAAGEPDCSWLLDATDSEFAAGWQGLPWSLAALADATGGSAVDLAALDGIVPLLPVTV